MARLDTLKEMLAPWSGSDVACPTCGEPLKVAAGSCPSCESDVLVECRECGTTIESEAETCPECGSEEFEVFLVG